MKKILSAALAMASGALLASTVESANTFVTIKVPCTTTNTVIAVPLVAVGSGNNALNVTNFVLTTGLVDEATLIVNNNGTWYSFVNNNGTWEGAKTAQDDSVIIPEGTETIARGGAAMLHNEFTGDGFDVYLYGQLATASATVTIPGATVTDGKNVPTWTLVANGNLADVLVSAISVAEQAAGDRIAVPKDNNQGMKYYTYKDEAWMYLNASYEWTQAGVNDKIKVGTGFWYIRNSTGDASITWN